MKEAEIIRNIKRKMAISYVLVFFGELFLIFLYAIINNSIKANFDFHIFVYQFIATIEFLVNLFFITFIYLTVREVIILQYRNNLENGGSSREFYHCMKYMYHSAKGKKTREATMDQYLHALQYDDRKDETEQFISENREVLEKNKPIKYLHMQLLLAHERKDQELFEKYYKIIEKILLDKIDYLRKKKSNQLKYYQYTYNDLQSNKDMFNEEYRNIIEMFDSKQERTRLAIVLKKMLLAECFAHLKNEIEMKKCIDFCEEYGSNIAMVRRKISEIKLMIN